MSAIEFAILRFHDVTAGEKAFVNARSRSVQDAAWIGQVGLVEHHHNGHWVLRGAFAGHYLDVDEALHVSERGGAEGSPPGPRSERYSVLLPSQREWSSEPSSAHRQLTRANTTPSRAYSASNCTAVYLAPARRSRSSHRQPTWTPC